MMNPELKSVLVTGGAGYVGAHVILELLSVGYECIALDNLSNSCPESLKKVEQLTGKKVDFYNVNLLDKSAVDNVFSKHSFFAVIHCAGLKAVGESAEIPLMYYHNNVTGTIHLLECMDKYNCLNLVFSSSATVYGNPQYLPLDEKHPVGIGITNPYGKTKFFIEEIIKDLVATKKCWNTILLRYFNPIGAHKSGMIGEDPQGIPNNLMPYISQVAVGRRSHLNVFGNDYETVDGTGVRDYIHVVDLAIGHVAAVKKLNDNCGYKLYNLGSGKGFSVLEMVKAMEGVSGKQIACKFVDRRAGDLPSIYADASLAFNELQWKTERGLEEMCADTWNWQSQNPNGYLTCNDQAKK